MVRKNYKKRKYKYTTCGKWGRKNNKDKQPKKNKS